MDFIDDTCLCRNLWSTSQSGNFSDDFERGQKYATQFIAALRSQKCSPFFLTEIVKGFPDEITTVEHAFLSEICSQLL